jgi:hypothetical protein
VVAPGIERSIIGGCDFNKDGKLDVIAGGQILFGNGDGTFRRPSISWKHPWWQI